MQNQNNPQGFNNNDNSQVPGTGYTDFYNNAPVDPNQQVPNFDTNAYDPNTFYNQANIPSVDPNSFNGAPQDMNTAQMPPAFDPNAYNPQSYDPNNMGNMNMGNMGTIPAMDPMTQVTQPQMQAQPSSTDTFQEPKSGNKFLLIGVLVLIVILIGVAGAIAFMYRDVLGFGGNPAESSSSASSSVSSSSSSSSSVASSASASSVSTSDSNATPAQKSRVYNETATPSDWLKQYFASQPTAVDSITGRCLQSDVCDNSSDPDKDGLTNIQEYNYQTDPLNPDTDSDKLSDGDEINVYSTDPKKADSDTDTYSDSDEVLNCYNPTINGATVDKSKRPNDKLLSSEQNSITTKILVSKLHEPTITTMKNSKDAAALTKGFAKCVAASTSSVSSASSSTPTTAN